MILFGILFGISLIIWAVVAIPILIKNKDKSYVPPKWAMIVQLCCWILAVISIIGIIITGTSCS